MEQQRSDDKNTTCAVCSRKFSKNDMIFLDNKWVCGECKPSFVQMLQEGTSTADMTIARHKKTIVMGKNASLPDRCVKCNAPATTKRLKKNLYWHSPVVYILVLVNILIYALVATLVRKKAKIDIPLCKKHSSRRKICILVTWVLSLTSIALIIGGIATEIWILVTIGTLLFVGGMIYAAIVTPVISTRKIDKEYIWLNGVCKEFLDTLPEWVKPS